MKPVPNLQAVIPLDTTETPESITAKINAALDLFQETAAREGRFHSVKIVQATRNPITNFAEPNATAAAVEAANAAGIKLEDVPHDGNKITKTDVETFAANHPAKAIRIYLTTISPVVKRLCRESRIFSPLRPQNNYD